MGNIQVNDPIRPHELTTIQGERITIPVPEFCTHPQFRRFAGCPGCKLHLRSIAKRHDEIRGAGLREVVVFYSSAQAMKPHQGDLPFAIISDLRRALYEEFGVQIALRSVLSPTAWVAWAKGAATLSTFPEPPTDGESKLGLPAEFLIGADGRVQALKYGAHAYDQWSVDQLLGLASEPAQQAGS